MSKLSEVMERQDWEWLQDENMDAANALASDVSSGMSAENIRRDMLKTIGPNRTGLIARCHNAARHLERQREKQKP